MFSVTEQQVIGGAVRSARLARGLSLRTLAARLGVSPATLSAVENGRSPLTVARLQQIADLLEVPAAGLLRGDTRSAAPPAVPSRAGDWRDFSSISLDPVLEGATRLFVRQGFHATSMREVAAEAGLSVAGVYHHYPSKEQILVALLDFTMAEISWRIEAARVEHDDPVESFALMVESLALFHAVRADLAFLGASEMRAFSPPERARIAGLRDSVQHALDAQAQECITVGAFDGDDVRTATRAIATMCTALPSWFRPDGPLSAEAVARKYSGYALALMGSAPSAAPGLSREAELGHAAVRPTPPRHARPALISGAGSE
jgi:AcrR family transcriptional regulator/transcriptional regulator with XRE-family HTH domain